MEIICESLENNITCIFPESLQVKNENIEEIIVPEINETFLIDKSVSYGDLMITFFLVLVFLTLIFNIIFNFWLDKSFRIKKHEL
ncbi:MAG: hypothetical protein PHH71_03985 [Clostridia bacterium]|nr:hypothetical protein [Clostridia bacterium]